ncbi:mechanosensitive ion channel family protein [Sporosarcina sp. ZBG7A]|uniref:mechanosensitive ion channel family protein n=1 Tax=Sporosarcina sp. ZBG7A TaxID=1582223 RepID=UPI00057A8473|nr:mechanosensitive ion channel domain-containing protein [Sporosarcina sp. ZBG7A]
MPDVLKEYFLGLADSLKSTLKTPDAYLNKVALTVVILVLGLSLYVLFKKMILRSVKDFTKKIQLHKAAKQTMATLTVVAVLFIWIQAINVLVLIALLFGVIAVFMVRGLTNNIIGYFVIKYRKYFEIGHRVEINEIIGDVVEINSTSFKLLEVRTGLSSDANTGRIIKLPNSIIFNESIEIIGGANSFVWHELKYVLSFDSEWQTAEKIMTDAGQAYFEETVLPELKKKKGHMSSEQAALQPVFSVDTNDAGIVLVLRYLVDYRHGTCVKTGLQRKILPQLNEHPNIDFAIWEMKVFKG